MAVNKAGVRSADFTERVPRERRIGVRAIQILFGHSKIENTVRYLGVDVEDALLLAERTKN